MIDIEALLIIPLSFTGFVLKGIATFGPGIIMVPVGALIFGARDMVLLSGCLDLISNISLFKPQRSYLRNPFWLGMMVSMTCGACLGAMVLSILPTAYFDLIFGMLLVPVGLWTIFSGNKNTQQHSQSYPQSISGNDIIVSFLSGCMSGLSGITAPILAWYFNRRYNKQIFRDIMIPLLLASAISRVLIYTYSGALTAEILPLLLLVLPGLILGLGLGNQLFLKISQRWLSIIIGSLVSLSGTKLLFK